jgi:hypothetical protein
MFERADDRRQNWMNVAPVHPVGDDISHCAKRNVSTVKRQNATKHQIGGEGGADCVSKADAEAENIERGNHLLSK